MLWKLIFPYCSFTKDIDSFLFVFFFFVQRNFFWGFKKEQHHSRCGSNLAVRQQSCSYLIVYVLFMDSSSRVSKCTMVKKNVVKWENHLSYGETAFCHRQRNSKPYATPGKKEMLKSQQIISLHYIFWTEQQILHFKSTRTFPAHLLLRSIWSLIPRVGFSAILFSLSVSPFSKVHSSRWRHQPGNSGPEFRFKIPPRRKS